MSKTPASVKSQMQSALEALNEKLIDRREEEEAKSADFSQETNIFRILRLENHEIRHGAFLDFLLDPHRNVELAHAFAHNWITEMLEYDANGVLGDLKERMDEGEAFEILPLKGEQRFSEVLIPELKYRIDHAFEIKCGQLRRVIVLEYKLNGVLQNNLNEYTSFVHKKYKDSKYKACFFVMDLGSKSHDEIDHEEFCLLDKSTLINALEATLEQARRKDMQATRLYLEQYLEILNPEVEDAFSWRGLESLVWRMWNPGYLQYDDIVEVWEGIAEETIEDPDDYDLLDGFAPNELFEQQVLKATEHISGCSAKRNDGWIRLMPSGCMFRHLYLFADLWYGAEEQFLTLNISSWHDTKSDARKMEKQQQCVYQILEATGWAEYLGDFETVSQCNRMELTVTDDGELDLVCKLRPKNSNRIYGTKVSIKYPLSLEELEAVCCSDEMPPVFNEYMAQFEKMMAFVNELAVV